MQLTTHHCSNQAQTPVTSSRQYRSLGSRAAPRTPPAAATSQQPLNSAPAGDSLIQTPCRPPTHILGLHQLAAPSSLQQAWQQDTLPACLATWQQLQLHTQQLLQQLDADADTCSSSSSSLQQTQQLLLQLDALLGTCQQVLLLCGFLKDRHSSSDWRAAAAAVFVEARSLEQELCSDTQLQQALWACQQLEQGPEQQQRQHKQPEQQEQQQQLLHADRDLTASQPGSTQDGVRASCTDPSSSSSSVSGGHSNSADSLAPLARSLLRHMQLESLTPATFASPGQQQQVLSCQEQQAILSGLQAEQRVLLNKMQALLLDPEASPVVELDADSREILLAPLTAVQAAGAASRSSSSSAAAAAAAPLSAHEAASSSAEHARLATPGPAATQAAYPGQDSQRSHEAGGHTSTDGLSEVRLDLQLVAQLLQQHPDAAVRQEVYAAGLLQRLDGLLSLWGDLAEVRRKTGRMHGSRSYTDFVLQHSLLGSPEAAGTFCQQLAAALQPAASEAVRRLQQRQLGQGEAGGQPLGTLQGSDLPYLLHEEWQALLDLDGLQQLQPFLQLPGVLAGLDAVLQHMLGLRLTQRDPHPGEVWAEDVLVLELWRPADSGGSDSVIGSNAGAGAALGTVYLDLNAGYAAQLLLYGPGYPLLTQPGAAADGATSSSLGGSAGTCVALGLQSGGVLCGTCDQLALGLWELCHEMGHAVNFILSATSSGSSGNTGDAATGGGAAASHAVARADEKQPLLPFCCAYHMHASWLPVELLELSSALFEGLVMDASGLQLLCRHAATGGALPAHLAAKLAAFMRAAHYNPAAHQSMVLAMLFDLELGSISSRQLGRHATHHLWSCIMQDLSALPQVELTLQQVSVFPRLLATSGQGFGYAVAWSLAQLLQPALLQHLHNAAATVEAQAELTRQQQLWRELLCMGVEGTDGERLGCLLSALSQQHTCEAAQQCAVPLQQLAAMLHKHGVCGPVNK